MAKEVGLSRNSVQRIWHTFELQPHRSDTFKISSDPLFVDKVWDITGLYLNPPEAAAVLCVDEKSQVQALDRTQPILPMRPGLPERRTHDYERHGTTTLFAALDLASGKVMEQTHRRHRAAEFKKFLEHVDQQVPAELSAHLVLDNYSTHKTPEIKKWLLRHPRFELHFTPTYSPWMNLIERWFAELTEKWIRRGTHRSVRELETSIRSGSGSGTRSRDPTYGRSQPTRSSAPSAHIFNESQGQQTSQGGGDARRLFRRPLRIGPGRWRRRLWCGLFAARDRADSGGVRVSRLAE